MSHNLVLGYMIGNKFNFIVGAAIFASTVYFLWMKMRRKSHFTRKDESDSDKIVGNNSAIDNNNDGANVVVEFDKNNLEESINQQQIDNTMEPDNISSDLVVVDDEIEITVNKETLEECHRFSNETSVKESLNESLPNESENAESNKFEIELTDTEITETDNISSSKITEEAIKEEQIDNSGNLLIDNATKTDISSSNLLAVDSAMEIESNKEVLEECLAKQTSNELSVKETMNESEAAEINNSLIEINDPEIAEVDNVSQSEIVEKVIIEANKLELSDHLPSFSNEIDRDDLLIDNREVREEDEDINKREENQFNTQEGDDDSEPLLKINSDKNEEIEPEVIEIINDPQSSKIIENNLNIPNDKNEQCFEECVATNVVIPTNDTDNSQSNIDCNKTQEAEEIDSLTVSEDKKESIEESYETIFNEEAEKEELIESRESCVINIDQSIHESNEELIVKVKETQEEPINENPHLPENQNTDNNDKTTEEEIERNDDSKSLSEKVVKKEEIESAVFKIIKESENSKLEEITSDQLERNSDRLFDEKPVSNIGEEMNEMIKETKTEIDSNTEIEEPNNLEIIESNKTEISAILNNNNTEISLEETTKVDDLKSENDIKEEIVESTDSCINTTEQLIEATGKSDEDLNNNDTEITSDKTESEISSKSVSDSIKEDGDKQSSDIFYNTETPKSTNTLTSFDFPKESNENESNSDSSQTSDYRNDSPLDSLMMDNNLMEYIEDYLNEKDSHDTGLTEQDDIDSTNKLENWPNDEDSLNNIKRDFYEESTNICSPHPSSESDHAHCVNNLTERVAILSAESILDSHGNANSSDSEMTPTLSSPTCDDSNPELYVEKITYDGKELDIVYFEESLLEEGGIQTDIKIIRTIPVGLGGRIIGKKGKTKNELMKKFGAQLLIYNHPEEFGKQVLEITCNRSVKTQLEKWVNKTLDQITKSTIQTTVSNPEWLKPMIPLGKMVTAHIVDMSSIQNIKLRIYDPEQIKTFNTMQKEMNIDYASCDNTSLLPRPVAVGCICVAMVRPNCFLRAEIIEIYDDMAWVYLLDVGKLCQTYLFYLFKIREKYMRVPYQVVPARMPHAHIKHKTISPSVIHKRFLCDPVTMKPKMVRVFFSRMNTCCEPCVNIYVPMSTVSASANSTTCDEFVDLLELLVSIDVCSMVRETIDSQLQVQINTNHFKAFLSEKDKKSPANIDVPVYFQPCNSKFYEDFIEFQSSDNANAK